MKKRLIINLLAVCLLLTMLSPVAFATETADPTETTAAAAEETTETAAEETTVPTEAPTEPTQTPVATSGTCGDGLTWELDGGTLTVSGSGEMDDGAPWEAYKDRITSVIFTGGVTTVGAEAFMDCENLTSVSFGGSMREIGTAAFKNCTGLTSISLPSTFRRFGAESFMGCTGLKEVHCSGSMPSFNGNCLWTGNYITVYYPVNNAWPLEYVEELENNFGGRLEILSSAGDDPYKYTEPVETEETTETTPEETTVPTTEETTEPTVEPTTMPTAESVTEVTTEATAAPVQTEEITETTEESAVPAEEEDEGGSGLVWLFVVPVVLTVVIICALLLRGMRSKGGKYAED